MQFNLHPSKLPRCRRVRIKAGPLQGLKGVLVRNRKVSRFVISMDLIMRSVAVEIDVAKLEPVR